MQQFNKAVFDAASIGRNVMTRANSKSSFTVLAAGVVVACVALWLGNIASNAIAAPDAGYRNGLSDRVLFDHWVAAVQRLYQ